MNNHTYGSALDSGAYFDSSKTLKGAKRYATRHGFNAVYIRFNNGYIISLVSEKIGGKWIDKRGSSNE
jgi:hypothetical protein